MTVWQKKATRWTKNGKRCKANENGAVAHSELSKRFYGTLTLANGKRKQQPLTEDRTTSETLLRRLQTEADTNRANGADRYFDERQRDVGEFVIAYAAYLVAKGNTQYHVDSTINRVRALLDATKVKTVVDFDSSRILTTLAAWRNRKSKPISIATSNHYLISIKSFSRWLWQERKTPDDALAGLRRMNAETNRKRIRRPLTPTELERLLLVTQKTTRTYIGNDWHFTGTDRANLYAIAAYTGLRAGEIASLTKSSFDFAAMTWTIDAANTKNRKAATLPLSPALAVRLQSWFDTLNRNVLFPGSWHKTGVNRIGGHIKSDLKRAGIAYRDESGRYADFHSLRHTFITSLAKAGVHPAKAQRLARHSTIGLTMNVYTSLDVDDLRDAIGSI